MVPLLQALLAFMDIGYKMTEKIYVSEDGVKREATPQELAQLEIDKATQEIYQAELEAKITARQSALAKLAALGLTEEEIRAL